MRILKTTYKLISITLLITVTIIGCKNKYTVERGEIDSLLLKNETALNYLKIDLITINERKTEMKGQIAVLEKIKPDSSGMEFQMNFDKYKGIYTMYCRFIDNYDTIFNQVGTHKKRLNKIKTLLMNEKINKTEFRLAIAGEHDEVNKNLNNAEIIGHTIFQVEPDYQRLSQYFDPQIEKLITQFPELNVILNNSK